MNVGEGFMTLDMDTENEFEMPSSKPAPPDYAIGRPAVDKTVSSAADPFDDFDDDDFDDEFDDDFEEEWDDELPGDEDQYDDEGKDKVEDAPFSDDPDFDDE
jgi:hypothetical protein